MVFNFTIEEKRRFFVIIDKVDKEDHSELVNYFCSLGLLEAVEWLRENQAPWNKWAIACAAEAGHLEVVKWLRENGCPWDQYAIPLAAQAGHLEVVKWLAVNRAPWNRLAAFTWANQAGHLEVVEWLRENDVLGING